MWLFRGVGTTDGASLRTVRRHIQSAWRTRARSRSNPARPYPLSLEQLQSVHGTVHRPIAPRPGQAGTHRRLVPPQPRRERSQRWDRVGPTQPPVQPRPVPLPNQLRELFRRLQRDSHVGVESLQPGHPLPLLVRSPIRGPHHRHRQLSRRWWGGGQGLQWGARAGGSQAHLGTESADVLADGGRSTPGSPRRQFAVNLGGGAPVPQATAEPLGVAVQATGSGLAGVPVGAGVGADVPLHRAGV